MTKEWGPLRIQWNRWRRENDLQSSGFYLHLTWTTPRRSSHFQIGGDDQIIDRDP